MAEGRKRKLVVVQLSGGNDYLNCVVPYNDSRYIDSRRNVRITEDRVIPLDNGYGLNPAMQPIKELYDQGKVGIIHGVGYPVPNRSHFRSMDIWHTAEPTKVGNEGWLGNAVRQMHPEGENVVAAVNFGAGLPRALVAKGAPVASVTDLASYGLMNHFGEDEQRNAALDTFRNMYSQAIGSGPVMDFLSQTGLDALRGADILSTVPTSYSSSVEYATNSFAKNMKGAAQVLQTDVGTRICYTQHGSFDAHTNGINLQEGSAARRLRRHLRLLHGHEGARQERGRADVRVLGVRAPREGQRQRHRPRLRRRRVRYRRRRGGRPLQRVPLAGRRQAG